MKLKLHIPSLSCMFSKLCNKSSDITEEFCFPNSIFWWPTYTNRVPRVQAYTFKSFYLIKNR